VLLRVLANQWIPFYIMNTLFKNIVAMQWAILKIKEGLAYLSLDLFYDLKGKSQKLFCENVLFRRKFSLRML
jgi:hypothetical protein